MSTAGRVAALLLSLLLVLTGCTGSDGPEDAASSGGAGSATPEPPEPPRRPKVGDCHRIGWEQAVSPTATDSRVRCRRRHTAVTFHVGRVERTKAGRPRPVDSARVQRQVARACPERLPDFLGGTVDQVRRSLFRAVWFTPTLEQAEAGAGWFRCDVVATGAGESLRRLPAELKGVLGSPERAEEFALCATGEPGSDSFTRVPCSDQHAWRAVTTVDLEGDSYPGPEAVESAMEDACSDAATEVASDPLDVRWSQEGPTKVQWRGGQRHGFCWVPD